MTKRKTKSEIENLGKEALENLPADERLKLVMEQNKEDNKNTVEKLTETCPKQKYVQLEYEYRTKALKSFILAQKAIDKLTHTIKDIRILELEHIIEVKENNGEIIENKEDTQKIIDDIDVYSELSGAVVNLYVKYYNLKRFAEEKLDVSLTTWLYLTTNQAEEIVETTEEILEKYEELLGHIYESIEKTHKERGLDDSLNHFLEIHYKEINIEWEEEPPEKLKKLKKENEKHTEKIVEGLKKDLKKDNNK